jgi:hypothetical protein
LTIALSIFVLSYRLLSSAHEMSDTKRQFDRGVYGCAFSVEYGAWYASYWLSLNCDDFIKLKDLRGRGRYISNAFGMEKAISPSGNGLFERFRTSSMLHEAVSDSNLRHSASLPCHLQRLFVKLAADECKQPLSACPQRMCSRIFSSTYKTRDLNLLPQ